MKKLFLALPTLLLLAACSQAPKYANRAELLIGWLTKQGRHTL